MLTGSLVRLRPLDMADLDNYIAWINDPEVVEFLGGGGGLWTRLAESEWLEQACRKRLAYGDVTLAIETIEGRHIGSIGLSEPQPRDRHACLGIMIGDKQHWSRGYGTDAVRTLLRLAFDEMNLNRVWLTVDERNLRGIACYRKCGFVEEGRLRQERFQAGTYHDTLIMAVLGPEYRQQPWASP